MLDIDMTNRLYPEGLCYSVGPPPDARNDECLICVLPFTSEQPILTHKSCGNSFCAPDLLEWTLQSSSGTSCPMCRGDLGDPRPPNYDPTLALNVLLREGITDMPFIVDPEAFDRTPLRNRLVSTRVFTVESIDLGTDVFHPAMIGYSNPKGIEDLRQRRNTLNAFNARRAMLEAKDAAKEILLYWNETRGIRFVQEYMVPEFDTHTSIFCPVQPVIRITTELEVLREETIECRVEFPDNDQPAPGWWLKRTLRSSELLSLPNVDWTGAYLVRGIMSIHPSPTDQPYAGVQWALWQTNDPVTPVLVAMPRFPIGHTSDGRVQRRFWITTGQLIFPATVPQTPLGDQAMQHDPQLYDWRDCFEDEPEHGLPRTILETDVGESASYISSNPTTDGDGEPGPRNDGEDDIGKGSANTINDGNNDAS